MRTFADSYWVVFGLALLSLTFAASCKPQASQEPSPGKTNKEKPIQLTGGDGFSTPLEAVQNFYESVDAGDMETAKRASLFDSEEFQAKYLQATASAPKAFREFNKVIEEKFDGTMPPLPSPYLPILKKTETIPIDIAGSSATWEHTPGVKLKLLRTKVGWKVDLRKVEQNQNGNMDFDKVRRKADAVLNIVERIKTSELASPKDVIEALKKI